MCTGSLLAANGGKFAAYDPEADAATELAQAVSLAKQTNRHVLIQVGGNWCGWCQKLDKLFKSNDKIQALLEENFVLMHINYSKENQNKAVLAKLGFPQRFGFPVLLVLNGDGKRLHTQNTGYLEKGSGHNPDLVMRFLTKWSPSALDPSKY